MKYDYPKSIPDAANLLDQVMLDWYNKININRLHMGVTERCILGQLYSEYGIGRNILFDGNGDSSDDILGINAPVSSWISEINNRKNKPKGWSFEVALAKMKNGSKIRRKCWAPSIHAVLFVEGNKYDYRIINGFPGPFKTDDLMANDWEELNENMKLFAHIENGKRVNINGAIGTKVEGEKQFYLLNNKYILLPIAGNVWAEVIP